MVILHFHWHFRKNFCVAKMRNRNELCTFSFFYFNFIIGNNAFNVYLLEKTYIWAKKSHPKTAKLSSLLNKEKTRRCNFREIIFQVKLLTIHCWIDTFQFKAVKWLFQKPQNMTICKWLLENNAMFNHRSKFSNVVQVARVAQSVER